VSVRILEVREVTKPIASPIRNAYIDFSSMTTSLVAVVTDAVRDGRRVVGYGFNSNGRYGQGGLIRERFAPRLLGAEPDTLLDESGDNLDPDRIWAALMSNEKPGGHGERSVAVGTIDMAVWDAVAKIAGKPLFRLLAERHGREKPTRRSSSMPPAAITTPTRTSRPAPRDAQLCRPRLHGGQDEDRRRADRRRPAPHRGGARRDRRRSAAGGRRQRPLRSRDGHRLRPKMLRQYPLFWYEEPGDPLDYRLQAT
jgi:D(-)-tartrate dehydratase